MRENKRDLKRRDKKGRILRNGESQRSDGRYAFVYSDSFGKQKFLYSWKLEKTDPLPAGCRPCKSLREKEKEVQRDLDDGVVPNGGNLTVLELVTKYVNQKTGVSYSTMMMYKAIIRVLEKDVFGTKRIDRVKLSDAKEWFISLQENGFSYGYVERIRGVVKPAFKMAVDNDLLRKNPFDFSLNTVVVNDCGTREALTKQQEETFLDFVKNSKIYRRYYDGIFILFNTGLRISEFCGLTLSDIDLDKRVIKVNHQLLRIGDMRYVIGKPKTKSGMRVLPMTDEVYECFCRVIENRKKPESEPTVDGFTGFIFLNRNSKPEVAEHWEGRFNRIVKKYNSTHDDPLPRITPHVCRHTYCSNMAKSGMNPKVLQYLMGHACVELTLNTYTHLGFDDAKQEIERIEKHQ